MKRLLTIVVMGGILITSCSKKNEQLVVLKSYPLENLNGIIAGSGVELDRSVYYQGNAALKVVAAESLVVELFETGDLDVEDARLIYQARLKTADLQGEAYLEMWCRFPGLGDYFSRGLHAKLSGNTDWSPQETPFFLKKGENPENVKLNLVITGSGTVWIDDIKLQKAQL